MKHENAPKQEAKKSKNTLKMSAVAATLLLAACGNDAKSMPTSTTQAAAAVEASVPTTPESSTVTSSASVNKSGSRNTMPDQTTDSTSGPKLQTYNTFPRSTNTVPPSTDSEVAGYSMDYLHENLLGTAIGVSNEIVNYLTDGRVQQALLTNGFGSAGSAEMPNVDTPDNNMYQARTYQSPDGTVHRDEIIVFYSNVDTSLVSEIAVIQQQGDQQTFDQLSAGTIKLEGVLPANFRMETFRYLNTDNNPSYEHSILNGAPDGVANVSISEVYNDPADPQTIQVFESRLPQLGETLKSFTDPTNHG